MPNQICKIEVKDPNSQFAMENRNQRSKQPVCNGKSKSEIQTASLRCKIKIRDLNSQFAKSEIIAWVEKLLRCRAINNRQGCLTYLGTPDRSYVAAVHLWEVGRD